MIYYAWSVNLHLTSLYWKSTRLLQGFLRAHVWAIKCSLPKVHLKTKSYDLYCMTVLRVSDTVGCAFKGKASTHKGEKRKKRRWWWFRTQSKMGSEKLDEERSKINVVDTTKSLLCRKFQHSNIEYILAFNLYAGNFRSKCPFLNFDLPPRWGHATPIRCLQDDAFLARNPRPDMAPKWGPRELYLKIVAD